MLISTLGGLIKVWDARKRLQIGTISNIQGPNGWSENIVLVLIQCWIDDNTIGIASSFDKNDTSPNAPQMALLTNCAMQNNCFRYAIRQIDEHPHAKGISTMCSLSRNNATAWFTGGFDKKVVFSAY
jgi:hypothetical protein